MCDTGAPPRPALLLLRLLIEDDETPAAPRTTLSPMPVVYTLEFRDGCPEAGRGAIAVRKQGYRMDGRKKKCVDILKTHLYVVNTPPKRVSHICYKGIVTGTSCCPNSAVSS